MGATATTQRTRSLLLLGLAGAGKDGFPSCLGTLKTRDKSGGEEEAGIVLVKNLAMRTC